MRKWAEIILVGVAVVWELESADGVEGFMVSLPSRCGVGMHGCPGGYSMPRASVELR